MSAATAITSTAASTHAPAAATEWLALVRDNVEGLRYGVVQFVVHDGRVTQIERTEKTRLLDARAE